MSAPAHPPTTFNPLAGVLACILPGLGHAFLGDVLRGAYICLGVMGLFLGGMLIGGIDVIDRKEDGWWFVLQAGVGPVAFAVDSIHQKSFKIPVSQGGRTSYRTASPDPAQNPGNAIAKSSKSLGRVNEVGSLFAALAGMLNAIAVIDAFFPVVRAGRRRSSDLPPL